MPPSRSTSSALASLQADSRSAADAPKFPARLTTRTPVDVEEVAGDGDVLGRRPTPVQVREPEVHGPEPGLDDRREQIVEAVSEGLDRLESGVRRHVERAPFFCSAVPQLLRDVVRPHEREGQWW